MFLYILTPINSPLLILLIVAYFFTTAFTTYDTRIIQAIKDGTVAPNHPKIGSWIGWVYWIDWALLIAISILNWKIGIIVYITRFILRVLPVMELIGSLFLYPSLKKKPPKDP
jgi:hypothetical protein